ncbi:MAG: TPR end-of-group domain-containing protein [Myxococcales bacterium]
MPLARLAASALVASSAASARAEGLGGAWVTPLGTLALAQKGDSVEGTLQRAAAGCGLAPGSTMLEADILEDSLSGRILLCLSGCGKRSGWVPALLLVSPDGQRLSGALTVPRGCRPEVATPNAFVAQRAPAVQARAASRPDQQPKSRPSGAPPPPAGAEPRISVRPEPDPARRAKAHALAEDGAAFLDEGRFEQARERFQEAVKVDPTYAEGYNGIGASYRARNALGDALRFYKRSIQADPTIGDAYYNLACVYALQGKKRLALRYLRMARRNGYVASGTIERDDDLASLRGDADFRALLGPP